MTAQPARKTHTTAGRIDAQGSEGPASRVLDETADVRFLPSGLPLALRWRGGLWQVIGNPVSWSTSGTRQDSATTRPSGQSSTDAAGFWRFQAQTGPASPVLEFDMSSDARRAGWRLRRVAGVEGF